MALAIGRHADGGAALKVAVSNNTGRNVCVMPSAMANPRVTLYRRGMAVPRGDDFEPFLRIQCLPLPPRGQRSFDYPLKRLYPSARAGDRICYMLQWDWAGGRSSIFHKRQCIVFQ